MATVAKYVIDNEIVHSNTKKGKIKEFLQPLHVLDRSFNDEETCKKEKLKQHYVYVAHFRNLLLTNLISSMVEAYLVIGENPEISFGMDNDLKQLYNKLIETYNLDKQNKGVKIKQEPTATPKKNSAKENTPEEKSTLEKMEEDISFHHNLTPFQVLLLMYCRWLLLLVQYHQKDIFISAEELVSYLGENDHLHMMKMILVPAYRKEQNSDTNSNNEDEEMDYDTEDNKMINFELGKFSCNFIKKEFRFYQWFINLSQTNNESYFGGQFRTDFFDTKTPFYQPEAEKKRANPDPDENNEPPKKRVRKNKCLFAKETSVYVHKNDPILKCDWNNTTLEERYDDLVSIILETDSDKARKELNFIINCKKASEKKKYDKELVTEGIHLLKTPISGISIKMAEPFKLSSNSMQATYEIIQYLEHSE